MALFGKTDDKSVRFEEARESAPVDVRAASEPTDVQAHLGRGSRVEGTLTFQGSVRIDGQVEGQIDAKDTVIVGDSATVLAQIAAATIIIKGNVTGDLTAGKRVELRSPGRLLGNIVTPSLVIQDGVVFEGHCSMAGADTRAAEKADREKKVALFPKEERLPAGRVEALK
jgi:cytoskeletal protein CcmA (bactofilin family)